MEQETGGFIIPSTTYISSLKSGLFWRMAYALGHSAYFLGLWIEGLCYLKEETHHQDSFVKAMQEYRLRNNNGGG